MGNIEILAFILIAGSSIPYVIRIMRGQSFPSFTSWVLWLINSITILITYEQVNGEENIWVVRASVLDTVIVVSVLLIQVVRKKTINIDSKDGLEVFCFITTIILIFTSLTIKNIYEVSKIAFILAIIIELLSAYPQMKINFIEPEKEGPFAWIIYAFGYGLSLSLIENATTEKMILPLFMVILYSIFSMPLIMHRIKNKSPIKDWI